MDGKRPTGVIVFGVLLIVFASFAVISSIFTSVFTYFLGDDFFAQTIEQSGTSAPYLIATMIISLLIGIVGIGEGNVRHIIVLMIF